MSFKKFFENVKNNGAVLYRSSNWDIMLHNSKCYAIAFNPQCDHSFYGDMKHVYNLILQDIRLKRNIFKVLRRFVSLKKYFDGYDLKKSRIKYLLKL